MRYIKILSFTLMVLSVALIFAGGLVTTTDSGLTIPDWPTSQGQWFPELEGGAVYEHTHRVIAGATALLTLILYAFSLASGKPAGIRLWSSVAASLVLIQAALGGLTVLMGLSKPVSIIHALIGPTFLGIIAFIAVLSTKDSTPSVPAAPGKDHRLVLTLLGLAYFQLFSGAVVRHISGGWIYIHIFNALGLLAHAILLYKFGRFRLHARCLLGLTLSQWLLGGATFLLTFFHPERNQKFDSIVTVTLHQTIGAILLALSLLYFFRLRHESVKPIA